MIKLARPEWLYLIVALIPVVLAFIAFLRWRKSRFSLLGEMRVLDRTLALRSTRKHWVKMTLWSLAFVSLCIAAANPQIGRKYEKVQRKGVDVLFALDLSKSMLAEDIAPSRFLKARQFILNTMREMKNDRVGLIVFAGNAYLQVPLTIDYGAMGMLLQGVNTNMIPSQGTSFAEAVQLARRSFEEGSSKHKALVIITDGENHEEGAMEAIEEAADEGLIIHTVGVGTSKGAPIPVGRRDYKRDKAGNIVLSKLNVNMLQEMAAKGQGEYFQLTTGKGTMRALMKTLAGMEGKVFEEKVYTDFEDQYQWFLLLALLLVVAEMMISERKSEWLPDVNI